MNKKIVLILLVCILVLFVAREPLHNQIKKIETQNHINANKLSEQEKIEFENDIDNKTLYYYNNLSDELQEAYVMVYSMLNKFDESRNIVITEDELMDVFIAVLYDNPEIFWVDVNYKFIDYDDYIEFKPVYRLEKNKAEEMSLVLEEEIQEILVSAENYITDYDKELFFHNYLCEKTEYDEETLNGLGDSVYSALIDGKAICEGYSRTMQILLDRSDIKNYLVTGDGVTEDGTESHMWNVIEINGANYYLDSTWNDTGTEDFGYLYFNVTDDFISKDHLNIQPKNNGCVSYSANYFVMNNLYVEKFEDFDSLLLPVTNMLATGDNKVEILFSNKYEMNNAVKLLEKDNYEFFNFVNIVTKASNRNLKDDEIEYYILEDYNYMCLIFKEG